MQRASILPPLMPLTGKGPSVPVFAKRHVPPSRLPLPPPRHQRAKAFEQRLDLFFGTRNGVTLDPKEGVNYTPETLDYMTPRARADEITAAIVSRMPPVQPFIVWECCAGIGGNTLSFAESSNISQVYSFEIRDDRREMLLNNLRAYKLDTKVQVKGEFTGVPEEFIGSVLYFDPPWLSAETPWSIATKNQYLTEGITVGPYSLEEWLDRSRHCSLVVMRVPLGYTLHGVEGYEYTQVERDHSLVIYCTSQSVTPLTINPTSPQVLSEDWIQAFQEYLADILAPILSPSEIADYFNEAAMSIWIQAFSHESFSTVFNYEQLETKGDLILKPVFGLYLVERFPHITPKAITNLSNYYMSKVFQKELGTRLGFQKWVLMVAESVSGHIREDLFEAFIGALFTIGDTVIKGMGYLKVMAMITHLFSTVKLNMEFAQGDSKSQFIQRLSTLGFPSNVSHRIEDSSNEAGTTTSVIKLAPSVVTYLLGKGLRPPAVMGRGEGSTKTVAQKAAYDRAMSTLDGLGITWKWVYQQKETAFLEQPLVAPLVPRFLDKLRSLELDTFRFVVPKGTSGKAGFTVILIGVSTSKGVELSLATVKAAAVNDAKVLAVRKFLGV